MVDAHVFKIRRKNGDIFAEILPFLTHSENSIDGIEFHYIGDKELLEKVSRVSELASVTPPKIRLNGMIAQRFSRLTGEYGDYELLFVGVPLTHPKEYSSSGFENTIFFTTDLSKLVGEYFLMSFYINHNYPSREMQTLDGEMKNSKYVAETEEDSVRHYYVTFLLRLDRVKNDEWVFTNFGVVAENSKLIYKASDIFELAKESRLDYSSLSPEKILERNQNISTVATSDGQILSKRVMENGFLVPAYFRDYHIKNPKNRRMSYSVYPYELTSIGSARPSPPFRAISSVGQMLQFYDAFGMPANLSGREFVGIISKDYYLGFSDKLHPTENSGNWGFHLFVGDYVEITELPREEVVSYLSTLNVERDEEEKEFTKMVIMIDNFIERIRENVRNAVNVINTKRWQYVNNEGGSEQ